jgi:hypothetical protein
MQSKQAVSGMAAQGAWIAGCDSCIHGPGRVDQDLLKISWYCWLCCGCSIRCWALLSCGVCTCRLYKVHEESGKPFELEMSWICEESGWKHARVSKFGILCVCGVVPSAKCNWAVQNLQMVHERSCRCSCAS